MASASPISHQKGQPHLFFAAFFVTFSLGLVLPILYFVGTKYYAALEMEVPRATSWFQAVTPWPMIGLAVVTLVVLYSVRFRLSQTGIRTMSWAIIGCTAFVTFWGAFQLVSPMISVLSGLGKI